MDSMITAAAHALAAGDALGALKPGRSARRRACTRAQGHRDGTTRRSRSGKGALKNAARAFGPKEASGPGAVCRRRGRDCARLARSHLACQGTSRQRG